MSLPIVIKLKKGSLGKWLGVSLVFFIIVVDSPRLRETITHETIHYLQWKELWFIGFPFVYLYYRIKYGYMGNPMEKEAYHYDSSEFYIYNRPKFNWKNFR